MPRGRKRVVSLTSDEIRAKIAANNKTIEEMTLNLKTLKSENKSLLKDLNAAEAKEKEEASKRQMEEIAEIIKNSGKSLDEIKELLK